MNFRWSPRLRGWALAGVGIIVFLIWAYLDPNLISPHSGREGTPHLEDRGATSREGLRPIALRMAARLRERQSPEGFWLTSYTSSERFVHPQLEMNIFVTSMVVDVLGPVAKSVGMEAALARAHNHLGRQIEANGLVRYHGLPDGPGVGALGCVITPDADDTALVWRLAGESKQELIPTMLTTLERYRTTAGLYRTWLAPREQYVNIDPGRDPNPTDIGIQMDVLLMLANISRPAADELYRSLGPVVNQEALWVYYRKAPLLPILREGELRKMGYPLRLPRALSQSPVEGQQPWVLACEMLARYLAGGNEKPKKELVEGLLRILADGEFSSIGRNPPLFYHNDFTARVSRFYWSEDFGYAVWLRLYEESRDHSG